MRSRSIAGPIILVAVGVIFLLNNLGRSVPVWSLAGEYWPVLLIVMGVIGLIEVMYQFGRGVVATSRPTGFGGIFWVVAIIGLFSWAGQRGGVHIGPFLNGGVNILGSDYEYDVNATGASAGATRLVLDNIRGNLSLKGEDAGDVKVTGRKTIRAFNKNDADRADQQSTIKVDREGDVLVIRAQNAHGSRNLSMTTDLDITLPKNLDIETRGRAGDLTADAIDGSLDIINGHGDVRVSNIGKDVKVEASRGGLLRASGVKGNVDLQGHGSDVQIDHVQGEVTVNGEFGGTLEFRALARPMHFQSERSDFRVEQVPGNITLDLGDLKMNDVVGPIRFKTGTRDIQLTDATNSVEIDISHGDIDVRQTRTPLPKMDLHSKSGDLTVSIPEKASFEIDGRTRQGDVTNDFGDALTTEQVGRGAEIKGKDGNGPQLLLSTDRGSVTIKKN